MEMRIPKWNDEQFKKTLKSLEKKGAKFNVKDLGMTLEDIKLSDGTTTQIFVHNYDVDNETVYAVPGWEFIGTIEHQEPKNLIRTIGSVDFSDIPTKYQTCGPECEHCNKIRDRKDTYLVRNTDTGEYKQVGKACLKSYTGLNPAAATWTLGVENYLYKLELDDEEIDRYVSTGGSINSSKGYDTQRVIAIAIDEIKSNGYVSSSYTDDVRDTTKYKVKELYESNYTPKAPKTEIEDFNKWAENKDTVGSYEYNAKAACKLKYCEYRDFGFITSFVYTYYKDLEKQKKELVKQASAVLSEYAGHVGDKIIFKVKECRVLYVIEPYTYGGDVSYAWRVVDTDNHVIIWKTAQRLIPDMEVKATIKSLGEYRGEKQTTVTRGKIIYIPYNDDEAGKALDSLYQEWN